MGLFPHFFEGSPLQILTNVVIPELPLAKETLKFGINLVQPAIQGLTSLAKQTHPGSAPANYQYMPYYGQQSQYPQPYDPYAGGASWDYLTQSQVFSPVPPNFQGEGYSPGPLGFSMARWPEGFSQ